MEKLPMCRICLVANVRILVVNKNLHEVYEKLTDIPFVTEDKRPMLACVFCCAKLKQCYRLQRRCLQAEKLFAQMMNEDYEPKPLINQDHLEVFNGFIKSPTENISIIDVVQTESVAIKEELPAVCERLDDLEVNGLIKSPTENISIVDDAQSESNTVKEELPAVCERLDDNILPKEEYQSDDLEPENFDNSLLKVADIRPHHSELDLEEDVSLMEFKIEVEEEQAVSKNKRRVRETERAAVAKKPKLDTRRTKLEHAITAEQTKKEKSDSKVIRSTQKHNSLRTKIVVLYKQNASIKGISRQLGIARQTARLWVRRYLDTGDVKTKPFGRRTSDIYTNKCERHRDIVNVHLNSPFSTTRSSAQRHGISIATVRRHLHAAGINNYRPAKEFQLTEAHRAARVRFAQELMDFDWENNIVIFADENTFRSDNDGEKILWRKPNERCNPQNILPNRSKDSDRITLGYWGWMSSMGPGELTEVGGHINGKTYLEILQEVMLPTVRVAYPEGQIYFVHDNRAVHRSRMVKEWLSLQADITVIAWPAKSPDLNPIENMWGQMILNWDSSALKSKDSLQQEIIRTWELMRGSNIGWNMVTQMRSRLQQIILNEGHPLRD